MFASKARACLSEAPKSAMRHSFGRLLALFANIWLGLKVGNCDIIVKQKILVINETKRDKILLKLRVYDQENFHGIL
jgi:hypothetical protein